MRIALLVILLALSPWLRAASEADRSATAAQIGELKKQIDQVKKSIDRKQGQQARLSQQLRDSEREIGKVSKALRQLNDELASLGDNLAGLKSRQKQLEASIDAGKKRILAQIVAQYREGRQPQLQILLSGRDPDRAERLMHYYAVVNEKLAAQVRDYQSQLTALDETRSQADQTTAQMEQKRQRLQQQQAALNNAKAQRAAHLAALQAGLKKDRNRLTQLESNRKHLAQVLAQIQKSLEAARLARSNQAFAKLKGQMPWPVHGKVLRQYGSRKNGLSYEGMLIGVPTGTEVHAVHGGRVVFSDWLRGYGLLLIIDHGDGYMSLYGHNESLLRDTGTWVSAGEPIAIAGDSGGYDASGVYFAIRHKGRSTDPGRWLSSR